MTRSSAPSSIHEQSYWEFIVSAIQILAAGLTFGLLVYLGFALLMPERFQ